MLGAVELAAAQVAATCRTASPMPTLLCTNIDNDLKLYYILILLILVKKEN